MRKLMTMLAIPFFLLLAGCSYYLSAESRSAADHSVSFAMLLREPDAYRGRLVLLGGTVQALGDAGEGSRLLIEQHPLDSRDLPDEAIPSQGLFLAATAQRLDPARFGKDTLVSLAGTVTGSTTQYYQGRPYRLPVVEVRELHDIVIEQETHWGPWGGI